MNHLDLFSGIAGFALSCRMASPAIKTVAFCEIDPYCRKVIAKNFPGVPIHDDIKTLKGDEYGAIDLITAGYPCQSYSLAGKRQGENDDRFLWPEVLRIVKSIRPRNLLCENVAGHITLGLDDVLSDLEAIGYTCWPLVIPACAVDAPHRRDRVWIVANSGGMGCQDWARSPGQNGQNGGIRREARASFERCSSAGWPAESGIRRVSYGLPNHVDRLKSLGNSIVPAVAQKILEAMILVDSGNA